MADDKIIPGKFYRMRPDGTAYADVEYVEGGKSIVDLTYGDGIAVAATTVSSTTEAPVDCQNCGQRPGTEKWVGNGGVMDLVHGMYSMRCKICVLKAQLEHAYKTAAGIPDLEKELSELEDQSSTSTE